MGLRDHFQEGLARQLGRPEGWRGRVVGRGLNRGNGEVIAAAIEATGVGPGDVAADVGFGGGIGLPTLLERVGPQGRVHGVELSDTMLAAARRRHRGEVAAGRLTLQKGRLEDLPLPDGAVDGLITVNTVYFVDDLAAVFGQLARVLAPGGRAVVGVADPAWMARQELSEKVFRIRPVGELVDGLRAAGLDVRDEARDDSRGFHLLVAARQSR